MKAATLTLLASVVTVCNAQETGTSNAVLISALVFAILGCLVASIALGYVIYRGRKSGKTYKKVPKDEEEEATSVNGGYGYDQSHGHHIYAGSDGRTSYAGQKSWYYNNNSDEYEWGYIFIGGFCCVFWTVALGVFIWWVVTEAT